MSRMILMAKSLMARMLLDGVLRRFRVAAKELSFSYHDIWYVVKNNRVSGFW